MSFGIGLAAGIADQMSKYAFNELANKQQLRLNQGFIEQQTKANQSMTKFNKDMQLELWNDTNYKAQREQIEKAGLNVGLMYGMGGGGSATTSIAQGNVSGSQAQKYEFRNRISCWNSRPNE